MEMDRSKSEVPSTSSLPAATEMPRDKSKFSFVPAHLEKLFNDMREDGEAFPVERWSWETGDEKYFVSFEDTTVVPAICYTFGPFPRGAIPDQTLQIFSIKIAELKGENDLKWPLQVYGFIAIRDSIDPRRNLLFKRDRSNCQTITEKEPFLLLTGPSRAVVLIDPVSFEVHLIAKGQGLDKVLAVDAFASQHAVAYMSRPPRTFTVDVHGIRSRLELTLALLEKSVEATIMVDLQDGSWPKSVPGRVTTSTGGVPDLIRILCL